MRRPMLILGWLWLSAACGGAGPVRAETTTAPAPAAEPAIGVGPRALTDAAPTRFLAGEELLARRGLSGAFVVRAAEGEPLLVAGRELAAARLSPASTFKIPNALIFLETGVAPDEGLTLPWDGVARAFDGWNADHDLASAMEGSVVWYFQEMARRVGLERMAEWVRLLGYGNGEVGEAVDAFWLDGPLAISALEQVAFLERLAARELPVSERSAAIVERIVPTREAGDAVVHAKTGTFVDAQRCHCWLVGWVERDGHGGAPFALLLLGEADDLPRLRATRWETALELLELAGLAR